MKARVSVLLAVTSVVITILPVAAQTVTSNSIASDCNFVSFWRTSDGNCVDLTSFTQLGILQRQLEAIQREERPIVTDNMYLRPLGESGRFFLAADIINQSERPVDVTEVTFIFVTETNGRSRVEGSVTVPLVGVIPARSRRSIRYPVIDYIPGDIQFQDVSYQG